MCDDGWVNVAMSDDSLVVDMLLRLQQAPPPPKKSAPCLQLHWTVRQRRSRSAPRHVGASAHKKREPTRASPTTPLSWSGATSASGGGAADGSEGSSRPTKPLKTSRSKVANPSETTTTKKCRRKKTLAELKEEESVLLKEMRNLKSELAALRLTLENHRATNERLKKMKVDMESRQNLKAATTTPVRSDKAMVNQPQLEDTQSHPSHLISPGVPRVVADNNAPSVPSANDESCKPQEIDKQEASFLLPDLNLPMDEDLSPIFSTHGLS
ncbi:uncharacterized protein LOC129290233 [Prosopis cineraria]|uniref:uncharacterized protein LOC129290233 n=1 Tax=Prosopis cineraria TaxID=364024 RepID=UPI00240F4EEF|nr:uncharacterized protein LOC129290233 [Prosopis cineraria]